MEVFHEKAEEQDQEHGRQEQDPPLLDQKARKIFHELLSGFQELPPMYGPGSP